MVEGVILNGEDFDGCDHTVDASVELESKSGVVVEDPQDEGEYIFIDHYQIDHVEVFFDDSAPSGMTNQDEYIPEEGEE